MPIIGKKIIVLGCSGSGKSTFSKKLHSVTGLPLIHLDNIWWKPDKSHILRDEFDDKLNNIFKKNEWIIAELMKCVLRHAIQFFSLTTVMKNA